MTDVNQVPFVITLNKLNCSSKSWLYMTSPSYLVCYEYINSLPTQPTISKRK